MTGLAGTLWEPLAPPDGLRLVPAVGRELIGGPEHIKWRYDPIIPTVHSPERFASWPARRRELGMRQGVINFVAPPGRYVRVDRRLGPLLPGWVEGMPGYGAAWQKQDRSPGSWWPWRRKWRSPCHAVPRARSLQSMYPGCGSGLRGVEWFLALSGRAPVGVPFGGSTRGVVVRVTMTSATMGAGLTAIAVCTAMRVEQETTLPPEYLIRKG